MNRLVISLAAVLALGTAAVSPVVAQISAVPSATNFQGRLATPSGNPVPDGTYSIHFSLHDALTGGTEKYSKTIANVAVKNGTFAVTLDAFPANTFNGNLWLEVKIGTDAPLTPRTPLVSVPYALKSDLALTVPDGSLTASKFASGVLNANAWLLGGNSGVTSSFLGITDNNPLEFRVNGKRVMCYSYAEYTAAVGVEHRSINILGGSELNIIDSGIVGATISGGGRDNFSGVDFLNRVTADYGTISGGAGNTASEYATVGGGRSNTASSDFASVGGGFNNIASNLYSTVAGGRNNTASGQYSFAAGYRANAIHNGAFVWADSLGTTFASTAVNQFNVRASGGVRIFTNAAATIGVTLLASDSSWNSVSDRNAKTAFGTVDTLDILERLAAIPITTWNYKGVENPVRHIGPMAQDFWAAFKVGMDDKHIGTIDADGVALAAIQGLNRKLEQSNAAIKAENAALKAENAEMKARLDAIERTLAELKVNSK